jgi:hypothetical protein
MSATPEMSPEGSNPSLTAILIGVRFAPRRKTSDAPEIRTQFDRWNVFA